MKPNKARSGGTSARQVKLKPSDDNFGYECGSFWHHKDAKKLISWGVVERRHLVQMAGFECLDGLWLFSVQSCCQCQAILSGSFFKTSDRMVDILPSCYLFLTYSVLFVTILPQAALLGIHFKLLFSFHSTDRDSPPREKTL